MIDQSKETSDDITLSLKEENDHYEMTIDASEEWLKDENVPIRFELIQQ